MSDAGHGPSRRDFDTFAKLVAGKLNKLLDRIDSLEAKLDSHMIERTQTARRLDGHEARIDGHEARLEAIEVHTTNGAAE